jgi:DNA-binding NtrC family response regulator
VSAFEKRYIEEILRRAEGKLTDAARLAVMDNKNFSEKLKRHGVTPLRVLNNPSRLITDMLTAFPSW